MLDVQNQPDHRNIAIDKVGVKNIRYPITVLDRANGSQQTVASINMYVNLPHQYKGTTHEPFYRASERVQRQHQHKQHSPTSWRR